MSVTMSLAEFEDLVAEALDSIPDDLASHMVAQVTTFDGSKLPIVGTDLCE